MLGRHPSPPVLAEIPTPTEAHDGIGTVDRTRLDGYRRVLGRVGGSRVVLLTGAGAKSGVAVGMATAAVVDGRRTVLVECDLASPTLASRLSLAPGPGLAEYLSHDAEAPEILQPLVLAGPEGGRAVEPLVCIVAGRAASRSAPLLASGEFSHAMEKLRNAYELVVVDAPSLIEEEAMIAAVSHVDFAIAFAPKADLPKRLRVHIDGIVEPAS